MEQTITEKLDFKDIVDDILKTIPRDREREIIARRFGLYQSKQTLEEIGDLLGITRERVRQLEKAILNKLQEQELPHQSTVNQKYVSKLEELGRVARLDYFGGFFDAQGQEELAHIHLLAVVSPDIEIISENDQYYQALALKSHHDEKEVKKIVEELKTTIKNFKEPVEIEKVKEKHPELETNHIKSLLSISKQIATLDNKWGLNNWPSVNPKNIRDKIYVILSRTSKPLHFNEISKAIKDSDFKRSDVTTQAIHNELIKDGRFVLIGRGIYALKEWGYTPGTVADMIESILRKDGPLHKDEIIKRVLKQRHVKETTILLNLQGKPQFKRVAKATYALGE